MAKPNSLLTRIRFRISEAVKPGPDPGEAWCIRCQLQNRRNVVLAVDGTEAHIDQHTEEQPEYHVRIIGEWPR